MRKAGISTLFILMLCASITWPSLSYASTDGIYTLSETTSAWEGADGGRLPEPGADYDYAYGDESSVTYTLPWAFNFYGQSYDRITADTNGNIWFGFAGSAYSFSLPNTGNGPVISAWNNDLSSYYYGGVYIRHKTDPERVVVEWRSETYGDEGLNRPNNFEVVFFTNGAIRVDYNSFNPETAGDSGSGISMDDGEHYLSISSDYGSPFTLAGHSYKFTDPSLATYSLNLVFTGSGSGTITSSPAGLACSGNCSTSFPQESDVILHPQALQYSIFTGWISGPCSGTGDCTVSLSCDTIVAADFIIDTDHQVNIDGDTPAYYTTIQEAYNASASGNVIRLWAMPYSENLLCGRDIEITFRGGYDSGYANITGDVILDGSLTVGSGIVIPDGLSIR